MSKRNYSSRPVFPRRRPPRESADPHKSVAGWKWLKCHRCRTRPAVIVDDKTPWCFACWDADTKKGTTTTTQEPKHAVHPV